MIGAPRLPEDDIPDVQRLLFYKRLAQAGTDDELCDVVPEMQDRYGEVPKETENLRELMALKTQGRKLKLRAMESGPGRLVATLDADAVLDPVRMAQLVARSKEGLTPDMKLIYPLPEAEFSSGHPQDALAQRRGHYRLRGANTDGTESSKRIERRGRALTVVGCRLAIAVPQ